MKRIALATCLKLPEPDPDAAPLVEELKRRGADAQWIAWDDPQVNLAAFDLCVIRSTWNYIHRHRDFLDWARRAAKKTRLLNPLSVVRWNSDKGYLTELEGRGIPIVPTLFVERGPVAHLREMLHPTTWSDVVIKPRVGAASFATRRFSSRNFDEGAKFLSEHAARRPMLIQPYLKSVETHGERALVWIDGKFTHAVTKRLRLETHGEGVSEAQPVSKEEAAFATRVLEPWASDLLYARVDLARDERGGLVLMELELIEPSLFLTQSPAALGRLAAACLKSCRTRPASIRSRGGADPGLPADAR